MKEDGELSYVPFEYVNSYEIAMFYFAQDHLPFSFIPLETSESFKDYSYFSGDLSTPESFRFARYYLQLERHCQLLQMVADRCCR